MSKKEKEDQEKDLKGEKIIYEKVLWSMGIGIVPLPLVSTIGTSAVQLRMINQLSELYGVSSSQHLVKSMIGALLGGVGGVVLTQTVISFLRPIPMVNMLAMVAGMPLMMGATTYGLGKVFALHFASGGTLLDFDPQKLRIYFKDQVEEGKKVAANFGKKATT